MGRLDESLARFQASLESLDANLAERMERDGDAATAAAQLTILKMEHDRLSRRNAVLEEEMRGLQGISGDVESRLDDVIEEIRQALGRN